MSRVVWVLEPVVFMKVMKLMKMEDLKLVVETIAILYLWEIAEGHDLLETVLQKINVEHHLDNGVSPEIVTEKKEKSKKKKDTARP